MNIGELQAALEYSREQLFQAEKRLDTATEGGGSRWTSDTASAA